MRRLLLLSALGLTLAVAQLRRVEDAARLELSLSHPARIYLYKGDSPLRLHPVDSLMAIKGDLFYRDVLWRNNDNPATMEVVARDQSHVLMLNRSATFDLPPGDYRVEAYRGLFFTPAVVRFTLQPGETKKLPISLERWDESTREWLSADDHIHLPRTAAENTAFLKWLEAEDLSVGHFLQLQRQIDAAPQYAFGRAGEARRPGYSIRSGQETRWEYYGHINLLGGDRLIRPLSVGKMYANEPGASPFPSLIFDLGKKAGALTGFAHFHGSMPHSTLLMDLALGNLDFIEVFQFGKLWTEEWYELLNGGLRVTGIAGSDFPVHLGRFRPWPARLPLMGPERALVKAAAGDSAYEAWAAGVRRGEVVVSNGPLVEISRSGREVKARASYHEPLVLEIVRNGKVVAVAGDGTVLNVSILSAEDDGAWYAARARAPKREDEPQIQAHTNPLYSTKPRIDPAARKKLADRWEAEMVYYRSTEVPFGSETQRREFLTMAGKALEILRQAP